MRLLMLSEINISIYFRAVSDNTLIVISSVQTKYFCVWCEASESLFISLLAPQNKYFAVNT